MKEKSEVIVKYFIKITLIIVLLIIIFIIVKNQSYDRLKNFEQAALNSASEEYGENCLVVGTRYDSNDDSCVVKLINGDSTLLIGYRVRHYTYDDGTEAYYARKTTVSTDVTNIR